MRVAVAALVAALVVVTSPLAATEKLRVIGRATISGDFATTIANGRAPRPATLAVRVLASPNQLVDGNWNMVCSKGVGAITKSGTFAGRTPLTRSMRFRMARPDDCTVAALASLKASGRLTVLILKAP